jgi:hypothetical protein
LTAGLRRGQTPVDLGLSLFDLNVDRRAERCGRQPAPELADRLDQRGDQSRFPIDILPLFDGCAAGCRSGCNGLGRILSPERSIASGRSGAP